MLFEKLTGNVLMSNQSTKSARLLIGAALTSLLLVSACDRQSERLERAREIAEVSLRQITGETIVEQADRKDPMRSVPVEARAIAGKVISPRWTTGSHTSPLADWRRRTIRIT